MKLYELAFLISPEIKDEEVNSYLEKVDNFIKEEGGVLVSPGRPLKTRLAYPIKKQTQAFLASIVFQLETERVTNLEKKIRAENQILRYLILIKETTREVPRRMPRKYPLPPREEEKPREEKVGLESIDEKLDEILGKE